MNTIKQKILKLKRKDVPLKDEVFLVFLRIGTIASLLTTIRAFLQLQNTVILANCLVFLFVCSMNFFCIKASHIKICKISLLLILSIIFFPYLFFKSGGIVSAMPMWFIMAICISATVLEMKEKMIVIPIQIIFDTSVIILSMLKPELVHVRQVEIGLYIAIIVGFIIISAMVVSTFSYIINRVEGLLQELNKARLIAEDANNTKDIFLTKISHEMRTPLNVIKGLSEANKEETDLSIIQNRTKDIYNSTEILLSLINNLLDFTQIKNNKLEVKEEEYNINDLINNIRILEFSAISKELDFDIIADNLPEKLYGSIDYISKICISIVSNAVKYTKIGKVIIKLNFEKENDTRGKLIIKVIDTGKGIKEEDINKIFLPFENIDKDILNHAKGVGIELSIVKNLINLLNGTITVKSEYGVGSTFIVEIPQAIVTKKEKIINVKNKKERTIVCVDDTNLNLKVIEALLKNSNCKIVCFTEGAKAISYIKENNPVDLIFMDIMMPEMSGDICMKRIKQLGYKVPIIALTADATNDAKTRYIEMGFTDYLSKPVNKESLLKMFKYA